MTLVTGYRGWIGGLLYKAIGANGLDLMDGDDLLTCPLPEADVVYHLAAQSSVVKSWEDPVLDSYNLPMTVRMVHNYPDAKLIYTTSAAPNDSSPYAFSKWAGAEYIKKFHRNYVVCQLPNVYGPGSRSVVDFFKENDDVTIYGVGEQTRDYVHVDDIVRGLIQAAYWPTGYYQLGSGIVTSMLDLAEGKKITFAPPRKEAQDAVIQNTTPDWAPRIVLRDYLYENHS